MTMMIGISYVVVSHSYAYAIPFPYNPCSSDVPSSLIQFVVTPEIENDSGSYFNQMGERIKGSTWLAADPGK